MKLTFISLCMLYITYKVIVKIPYYELFNPCPAEPGYTLPLQTVDPDQLASEKTSWSGSALFAIKHVNL